MTLIELIDESRAKACETCRIKPYCTDSRKSLCYIAFSKGFLMSNEIAMKSRKKILTAIYQALASDKIAVTYQTLGQYRTAIMELIIPFLKEEQT